MLATIEDLKTSVERLRKNREKVPIQILKTKYAKPYKELLNQISQQAKDVLIQVIFSHAFIEQDQAGFQEYVRVSNEIAAEETRKGTFRELGRILSREYDVDKFLEEACRRIWPRVWYEAYGPYWLKHCIRQQDGRIRNEIIDMIYNPEYRIWEAEDGLSFTLMLPPTPELLREEYDSWAK